MIRVAFSTMLWMSILIPTMTYAMQGETTSRMRTPWHFDPSACLERRDSAVYVAVGEVVFRLDYRADGVPIFDKPDAPSGIALPIDVHAPLGCYANPVSVSTLYLIAYKDSLLEGWKGLPLQPLISINVRVQKNDTPSLQSLSERLLVTMTRSDPCKHVGGGLVECIRNNPTSMTPSVLTARPAVYAAPMRRAFIVICGTGPGIYAYDCHVDYQLSHGIAVSYRLDRREMAMQLMVNMDRLIRERVEAMIVSDYPWRYH